MGISYIPISIWFKGQCFCVTNIYMIMTMRQRTHGEGNKLQTWRCPRRNLCNVLLGPGSPHTEYKCPTFGIAVHIKFRQAFLLCFIFSLNWSEHCDDWEKTLFIPTYHVLGDWYQVEILQQFQFFPHTSKFISFFLHICGTNMQDDITVWISFWDVLLE